MIHPEMSAGHPVGQTQPDGFDSYRAPDLPPDGKEKPPEGVERLTIMTDIGLELTRNRSVTVIA